VNQSAIIGDEPSNEAWYRAAADDVLARVLSSSAGLTSIEAARRLAANGPNELTEAEGISMLTIIGGQFKGLIIWILIGAGVISILLGERGDAAAILAIVLLNAVIGFYQEFKAERSIGALKKLTAPRAKVRRDGRSALIPASAVVAGDILLLEAGDIVAADARLVEAAMLTCIESVLTGESNTVAKQTAQLDGLAVPLGDRVNMVFMGTSIAAGTGQAVVVNTSMATELGRIAGLISQAGEDEHTPLEKKLESVGRVLVVATLAIVALLFGLGVLRGIPRFELFMTAVSLAVAAVPEGLPAVITVALSLGALRMSRRRALVRKLAAVETLGSTSVICTDKTGTLTAGEMTARSLYVADRSYEITGTGYGPAGEVRIDGMKAGREHAPQLLKLGTILLGCNTSHLVEDGGKWKVIGDPTEGALLAAGAKAGADRKRIESELPMVYELPFDSDRKRSAVIRRMPTGRFTALVNGAPGPLLQRCSHLYTGTEVRALTAADRDRILAHASTLGKRAQRVLASAYRDLPVLNPAGLTPDAVECDLVFVGLTGMYDPPRPESASAVRQCRSAGIRVVMITGDHPDTAAAIAQELGIGSGASAITGAELDAMSAQELQSRVRDSFVYARVTARHKLRIIQGLKAIGDIVAMTGDGVNDAPALKGSDIGIAMGISGTEVTKQAADMIIADDNFATIVAAVEEGRGIYDNIRKTLQYLLAGNMGELLLMTICITAGLPTPLLPIHLLWINLVTDGLPALCLATDPIDPDVMKRRPRLRSEKMMNPRFLRTMALTGFLTAGTAFAVYWYVLAAGSPETARTSTFAVLVFAELFRSFGVRSETTPVWGMPLLTNINLVIVVVLSIGLQLLSQHNSVVGGFLKTSPISFLDGCLLLAVGTLPLIILEIRKILPRFRSSDGSTRQSVRTKD
jgi:Ca2+-transporting ATPase